MFSQRRHEQFPSGNPASPERTASPEQGESYDFTSVWTVKAPVADVFAAISDYQSWPEWWSSVKSVDVVGKGADQRVHSEWNAGPYTLRFDTFDARIVHDEAKGSIHVTFLAEGDLNGTGAIGCLPDDGNPTYSLIEINWQVATRLPWMNKAAPMLKGFFGFNHGRIMRQGEEEFNQYMPRFLTQHKQKE